MNLRLALLSAVVLASPVLAQSPHGPRKSSDDPNKMICRKFPVTGSLTQTKRICHTRAQWKELGEAARRDTETMQTSKNGVVNN